MNDESTTDKQKDKNKRERNLNNTRGTNAKRGGRRINSNRSKPKDNGKGPNKGILRKEKTPGGYINPPYPKKKKNVSQNVTFDTTPDQKEKCKDAFELNNQNKKGTSHPGISNNKKNTINPKSLLINGEHQRNIFSPHNHDVKEKEKTFYGASVPFLEKYNNYLDSITPDDELNLNVIKAATVEDLYCDDENDMSDDEICSHMAWDGKIPEKCMEILKTRKGDRVSLMTPKLNIIQIDENTQNDQSILPKLDINDPNEHDKLNPLENKNSIMNKNTNYIDFVDLLRVVSILNKPYNGDMSVIKNENMVLFSMNQNPYIFFERWFNFHTNSNKPVFSFSFELSKYQNSDYYNNNNNERDNVSEKGTTGINNQNSRKIKRIYQVVCVQLERLYNKNITFSAKAQKNTTEVHGISVICDKNELNMFKKFMSSKSYLNLTTYFNGIKDVDTYKYQTELKKALKLQTVCKNYSILDLDEKIEFDLNVIKIRSYEAESMVSHDASKLSSQYMFCSVFEKKDLNENWILNLHVYYTVNLKINKTRVSSVFYVIICNDILGNCDNKK